MRPSLALLVELAGFVGLLAAAWYGEWAPGELAWGLWSAGFVLVLLWLGLMALLRIRQDGLRVRSLCTTIVAVAVVVWGLVWVYRFYGELLDLGYPLQPDPDRIQLNATTWRNVRPFAFWPTLGSALLTYYAVIAVSLIPMIVALRRAWPSPDRFGRNPGLNGAGFAVLHFTVMALLLLQMLFQQETGLRVFLASATVLSINYFPWQRIRLHWKSASSMPSAPPERA